MALEMPPTVERPLLLHGDCIEQLRRLPDASVHVVISDPPAGIGFMGKPWDSFAGHKPRTDRGRDVSLGLDVLKLEPWACGFVVFLVDVWVEVRRVLIPGGLVCAWALPKTADLAGLALRLAGFEMRDSLLHLFGGGMNKTGDIGKQIDRAAGAEREVIGEKETGSLCSRGDKLNAGAGFGTGHRVIPVTAPATETAKRWTGWHSGIAPGHEQWLVAQAPGRLTYARQLVERGCGAFNVDACRVPRGETDREAMRVPGPAVAVFSGAGRSGETFAPHPSGSHPRNVILTPGGEDCPAEGLDRQSGVLKTGGGDKASPTTGRISYGERAKGAPRVYEPSEGGASRYFTQLPFDERVGYFPKASDRRAGLGHERNEHPTHKHIGLMRWLVRLMAAKAEHTGGDPAIVLDWCMGSGSTGVACVAEQVRFVGIELEEKHFAVARSRIMAAIGSPEAAAEANESAPVGAQLGLL